MKKTYEKAFTLIELLVVIAIIGILATVVLVNLSSTRGRARDARRKSDLSNIRLALEMYYDEQAAPAYPNEASWAADIAGYMSGGATPTDPRGATYVNGGDYCYKLNGDVYEVCALLEGIGTDVASSSLCLPTEDSVVCDGLDDLGGA
ncbi:type II secretion system protein [bacterium]|nr:MAG: type II secretion system protein [bacterium]